VQIGKDGLVRLLNRQNLSGQGGPGHLGGELQTLPAPGGCEVLAQPVVWTDATNTTWIFVANDCGLAGYTLGTSNGTSRLSQAWEISTGGSSPILVDGVLFDAHNGAVTAYNPSNGAPLWTSTTTAATIGGIHWEGPILVNGTLLVPDESAHLTALGLPFAPGPDKVYLPIVLQR
jgi:outer membrane protein assembly factor BamB